MKFITTTVAALAVVTTLGWLLFGGELGSVVETSLSRTRTGMGSNLSHEFRADQAELQLGAADQEIGEQEKRVAELRVHCRELASEVEDLEAGLELANDEFVQLDQAWARTGNGARPAAYRSRLTDAEEIQTDLERVALRITANTSRLEGRRNVLTNQRAALEQAETMLRDIRSRRERVALAIESSRIDLESVRLLQSATGSDVEASSLAAAEELAMELARELSIEREYVAIQGQGRTAPRITDVSGVQAVDRVRADLGLAPAAPEEVAVLQPHAAPSGFTR